jgi:23S rRNA pseudouridine1911/1915/1917 synthase
VQAGLEDAPAERLRRLVSGRTERVAVPREARGLRLDRVLVTHVAGLGLERARTLCEEGRVRIRGKAAQASRKLWGGEEVVLELPAPTQATPVVDAAAHLPVLFDDASIVVVHKPAGLVVERDAMRPSVVGLLAARLQGFDCAGRAEPAVVHRLDRETSGCLVLAKTDAARAALVAAFDAKEIDKRYLALVLGRPSDHERLDTPYGRSPDDPRKYTTRVLSPRRARLRYETLERFDGAALVSVELDTGRTHQIRVQLSERGFPVLGDGVYGPREAREHPAALALGRHALHAARLSLPHPVTRAPLAFEAPQPPDFTRALELLRRAKP